MFCTSSTFLIRLYVYDKLKMGRIYIYIFVVVPRVLIVVSRVLVVVSRVLVVVPRVLVVVPRVFAVVPRVLVFSL